MAGVDTYSYVTGYRDALLKVRELTRHQSPYEDMERRIAENNLRKLFEEHGIK